MNYKKSLFIAILGLNLGWFGAGYTTIESAPNSNINLSKYLDIRENYLFTNKEDVDEVVFSALAKLN
ncbi:hypothetical protein [Photobacterium leiognathi]|uniref:hypothetical protein n=1 Tax=Photobacterium leiognathi TaxID=553611 RepID=UPI0029821B36|nr:hypothetical protein [Photobacterium leiognathi]